MLEEIGTTGTTTFDCD